MAKRQIHVRDYTKKDGTKVSNHERKIDAVPEREVYEKPPVNKQGVVEIVRFERNGKHTSSIYAKSQAEKELELAKEQDEKSIKKKSDTVIFDKETGYEAIVTEFHSYLSNSTQYEVTVGNLKSNIIINKKAFAKKSEAVEFAKEWVKTNVELHNKSKEMSQFKDSKATGKYTEVKGKNADGTENSMYVLSEKKKTCAHSERVGDYCEHCETGTTKKKVEDLHLDGFTGTENYYLDRLTGVKYTDGVKTLENEAKAGWLVSDASVIVKSPKLRNEEFITIKIVSKDNKAVVTYDDGNGNILYTQKYNYTDFPEGELKMFYTNGVMMLTSEY